MEMGLNVNPGNTVGCRYFTNVQLEAKPYATPFIDGIRDYTHASLQYYLSPDDEDLVITDWSDRYLQETVPDFSEVEVTIPLHSIDGSTTQTSNVFLASDKNSYFKRISNTITIECEYTSLTYPNDRFSYQGNDVPTLDIFYNITVDSSGFEDLIPELYLEAQTSNGNWIQLKRIDLKYNTYEYFKRLKIAHYVFSWSLTPVQLEKSPLLAIGLVVIVVGFKFARTTINPMTRVYHELHALNHHLAQLTAITEALEKVATHLTTEDESDTPTESPLQSNNIPQELSEIDM